MADPQDPSHSEADDAGSTTPPAENPAAKAAKKPAKAAAKKAPAKKAAAKKTPAKKAAAKKAPAKSPEQRIETNGHVAAAAKDVAAQAKSTVEAANNPIPPVDPLPASSQSPVPLLVALTLSLLAILLVRQLHRR
jgi:hypothetical protein